MAVSFVFLTVMFWYTAGQCNHVAHCSSLEDPGGRSLILTGDPCGLYNKHISTYSARLPCTLLCKAKKPYRLLCKAKQALQTTLKSQTSHTDYSEKPKKPYRLLWKAKQALQTTLKSQTSHTVYSEKPKKPYRLLWKAKKALQTTLKSQKFQSKPSDSYYSVDTK